jgi:hypothetical protein
LDLGALMANLFETVFGRQSSSLQTYLSSSSRVLVRVISLRQCTLFGSSIPQPMNLDLVSCDVHVTQGRFRSEIFGKMTLYRFSLLFDKYCPIMV